MKKANPVFRGGDASRTRCATVAFAMAVGVATMPGCGKEPERVESVPPLPAAAGDTAAPIMRYTYEVVAAWPHDPAAFTQGLVFRNGSFLESTGQHGASSLREVEIKTGRVVKQVALASQYFGEGLAVIGARAFQLTWQSRRGFIYDADTFQKTGEFTYEGEGWGLATDGHLLILSDGTSRIRFLDATTFRVTRTIDVTADGRPVTQLNELEFIKGEIFANVWMRDEILRIDPATGRVRGMVDCRGLLPAHERTPKTDVLNGIAYDEAGDRLFVTGKYWPKVFEVRLKVAK